MVSEAKKPLVASMAYLAIYLVIILAVTTYVVIVKEVKEKKNSGGTSTEPTKASGPSTAKSSGDKSKNGSGNFKRIGKKIMAANAMKAPKKYEDVYNIITTGQYLEPKPQYFLDRFQREYYLKILKAEESKEPKIEMKAVESTKTPDSPCRFFTLENTFELRESTGYFCYYNTTTTAPLLTKSLDLSIVESFIKTEKLKLYLDDIFEVSGQLCHIKIVLEDEVKVDEKVLTIENIKVLSDFLIKEKKSWDSEQLKKLSIPSGFGLFVGLEPPPVPEPPVPIIDAFHRDLTVQKKKIEWIRNVFMEKGLKAFYYGDPSIVFTPNNFTSIQDYAELMKLSGYTYFDNYNLIFQGINVTAHYSAKDKNVLNSLKLKIDFILDSIFDKYLTSSRNNLDFNRFIKRKDFCILFVYAEPEFEPFFKSEEIQTYLLKNERFDKSSFFIYNYRVDILKIENFEDQKGKVAYKFSMLCDGYEDPINFSNVSNGTFDVRIAGIVDRSKEEAIIQTLIDNINDEESMKTEWINICKNIINTFTAVEITIIK